MANKIRHGAGQKGEVMERKKARRGTKDESVLDRVKAERDELQQRLSRLCSFMDDRFEGCKFLSLSPADRILLEWQRDAMQEYRDILDVRIELMERK